MKAIAPIFAALGGVAAFSFILLACMLGYGDRVPKGLKSGKNEVFDLVIEAGDTSWCQLVLKALPEKDSATCSTVLYAKVKIERPKRFCVRGVTPMAGRSTYISLGPSSTSGFLVDGCTPVDYQALRQPLVAEIRVLVPDNLQDDAIIISNR